MNIKGFIQKVLFIEILKGMALTLSRLFTRAVTRQYPEEKRPAQPGFRGLHALARRPDGTARCVGCGLCAAICPSECIHVYTTEGPDHQKVVVGYEIEVLRCVYCALCVEACPFQAVVLTEHFEYSNYSRKDFHMTMDRLLENWDKYMAGEKGEEYFKRFWHPLSNDYKEYEGQPIFDPERYRNKKKRFRDIRGIWLIHEEGGKQ
jgi:NADH-quinone oxidoreductase chain I